MIAGPSSILIRYDLTLKMNQLPQAEVIRPYTLKTRILLLLNKGMKKKPLNLCSYPDSQLRLDIKEAKVLNLTGDEAIFIFTAIKAKTFKRET